MARERGFALFGVAPASPPDNPDYILGWIERGCHGDMAWLARGIHRRLHPQKVLPGARSIIMVGINYHLPRPQDQPRIAAYARGMDYHRPMETRLREMAAWLAERSGGSARAYVDTGPIIEREAAARAGLGWIGKSTMLVSQEFGTFFLLGTIIADAALPPDTPARDRCGSCARCINACPTGAIVAPYRLDPRLCISYLTIEFRGIIPEHLRAPIGDRIFGCDACLDACPWNRFARLSHESAFLPRQLPPLKELLELSKSDFETLFDKSPLRRAKWEGFLRNVCVAVGNLGDTSAIPALRRLAADGPPPVPEHAAWALRRMPECLG